MVFWLKNLAGCAGSKAQWMEFNPMSSGIPQRSAFKPIFVNIFITKGIRCSLSNFEDDSKLGSTINLHEGMKGSAEGSG